MRLSSNEEMENHQVTEFFNFVVEDNEVLSAVEALRGIMQLCLASDDLIPLEAIIDQEVSECMIEVRSETHKTMSLIRICDLSEEHVSFLKRSAEHHRLLVVNIVVGCSMNHQILLVGELLSQRIDITSLISRQVIIRCGQSKISNKHRS